MPKKNINNYDCHDLQKQGMTMGQMNYGVMVIIITLLYDMVGIMTFDYSLMVNLVPRDLKNAYRVYWGFIVLIEITSPDVYESNLL